MWLVMMKMPLPPRCSHIVQLANAREGEGFIAVSPEARKRFLGLIEHEQQPSLTY